MKEIERKFRVKNNSWLEQTSEKHPGMLISQAYLVNKPEVTIRLQYRYRPQLEERKAAVNIKMPREGVCREEIEMPFDPEVALSIFKELRKTQVVIDKVRTFVDAENDLYWEIDEFMTEELKGLVCAEIEVPSADYALELPDWVGEEVTDDPQYYNAYLAGNLKIPDKSQDYDLEDLDFPPVG